METLVYDCSFFSGIPGLLNCVVPELPYHPAVFRANNQVAGNKQGENDQHEHNARSPEIPVENRL